MPIERSRDCDHFSCGSVPQARPKERGRIEKGHPKTPNRKRRKRCQSPKMAGTELVPATISPRNQRDVSPLRLRSPGLHHRCRVCRTAATRRRRGGIAGRDGGAGEHVVRRRDRRHRVSRVERQRPCLHALRTSPPYGLVSHPPALSAMWEVTEGRDLPDCTRTGHAERLPLSTRCR